MDESTKVKVTRALGALAGAPGSFAAHEAELLRKANADPLSPMEMGFLVGVLEKADKVEAGRTKRGQAADNSTSASSSASASSTAPPAPAAAATPTPSSQEKDAEESNFSSEKSNFSPHDDVIGPARALPSADQNDDVKELRKTIKTLHSQLQDDKLSLDELVARLLTSLTGSQVKAMMALYATPAAALRVTAEQVCSGSQFKQLYKALIAGDPTVTWPATADRSSSTDVGLALLGCLAPALRTAYRDDPQPDSPWAAIATKSSGLAVDTGAMPTALESIVTLLTPLLKSEPSDAIRRDIALTLLATQAALRLDTGQPEKPWLELALHRLERTLKPTCSIEWWTDIQSALRKCETYQTLEAAALAQASRATYRSKLSATSAMLAQPIAGAATAAPAPQQQSSSPTTTVATVATTPPSAAQLLRAKDRDEDRCFVCHQQGHKAHECPRRSQRPHDRQQQQQKPKRQVQVASVSTAQELANVLEKAVAAIKSEVNKQPKYTEAPAKPAATPPSQSSGAPLVSTPALLIDISISQGAGPWRRASRSARLDPGAQVSAISLATCRALGLTVSPLELTVGGPVPSAPSWPVVGVAKDCQVDIQGELFRADFVVLRDELSEILIGLPTLNAQQGATAARGLHAGALRWRDHQQFGPQVRIGNSRWLQRLSAPPLPPGALQTLVSSLAVHSALLETAPTVMEKLDKLNSLVAADIARKRPPLRAPPGDPNDAAALTFDEDRDYREHHDEHMAARQVIKKAFFDPAAPPEAMSRFKALLREHERSFSDGSLRFPPIANVKEHFVRFPQQERDATSKDLPRLNHRLSDDHRAFLNQFALELIETGRAERVYMANGPIADTFVVTKTTPDGAVKKRRPVHNFNSQHRLMGVSQTNIPHIQQTLDQIRPFPVITEWDGTNFYYQFPLGNDAADRVTVRVGDYLLRWKVTPQGPSAAANHIAGFMAARCLKLTEHWGVWAYFDNFITAGTDYARHEEAARWFLSEVGRPTATNPDALSVTFNIDKSRFLVKNLDLLGKRLRHGLLDPQVEWQKEVMALERPTTRKEMHGPMGLLAFNHDHIAALAAEPVRLLNHESHRNGGRGAIEWTPELEAAWEQIKRAAADPMSLYRFDPELDIVTITDGAPTLRRGGAFFLCQFNPRTQRLQLIAAYTHTWTAAEQKYSSADAELQVFRQGCKRFAHWLIGRHFFWVSDSKSSGEKVQSIHMDGSERLSRTALDLQPFSFTVIHAPGAWLQAVDYWSRKSSERAETVLPPLKVAQAELDFPIVLATACAEFNRAVVAADSVSPPTVWASVPDVEIDRGTITVRDAAPSGDAAPTPAPAAQAPAPGAPAAPAPPVAPAVTPHAPPSGNAAARLEQALQLVLSVPELKELATAQAADQFFADPYARALAAAPHVVRSRLPGGDKSWFFRIGGEQQILLVSRSKSRRHREWRVAVPQLLIQSTLAAVHLAAAHHARQTVVWASRWFAAPGLRSAAVALTHACVACQRVSDAQALVPVGGVGSHLRHPLAPRHAHDALYCDIFFALGHMWLSVMCVRTRYLCVYHLPSKDSAHVSCRLAEHMTLFGLARVVWADAGSEGAGLTEQFCNDTNVHQEKALPEVHTAVGGLERAHREINQVLRKALIGWETTFTTPLDAHAAVLAAVAAINSHPRAPNDVCAFELVFQRRPPCHPALTLAPNLASGLRESDSLTSRRLGAMSRIVHAVLDAAQAIDALQDPAPTGEAAAAARAAQQQHAASHNAKYGSGNKTAPHAKVNDLVWVHTTASHQRADKIGGQADQRSGPYRIVATDVDGNPTRARVRFAVPLDIAPAPGAAGPIHRRWVEQDVDVRQLQPYRLLPPVDLESGELALSPLALHGSDWTDNHELVVSERTMALVLASTPPRMRDVLERELRVAFNAARKLVESDANARAQRERKKMELEKQAAEAEALRLQRERTLAAEAEKRAQLAAQKAAHAEKKKWNEELVSITYLAKGGLSVRGSCRDGALRYKKLTALSEAERVLWNRYNGRDRDRPATAGAAGGVE
jgi:hypothetical protein